MPRWAPFAAPGALPGQCAGQHPRLAGLSRTPARLRRRPQPAALPPRRLPRCRTAGAGRAAGRGHPLPRRLQPLFRAGEPPRRRPRAARRRLPRRGRRGRRGRPAAGRGPHLARRRAGRGGAGGGAADADGAGRASTSPVIGIEPSCLLTLRDEFPSLLPGEAAARWPPARCCCRNSWRGRSPGWRCKPIAAAAAHIHGHCHQKSFGAFPAAVAMLTLVPGLKVTPITSSCCGMAGAFGYEAEHLEVSKAMAELSLLPAVRAAPADHLIVADGTSCRHQIADLAGREALHSVRVLDRALGMTQPAEILDFWFGARPGPLAARALVPAATTPSMPPAATASAICWPRRGTARWMPGAATPQGALALLLVLDQFPRNLHRGTAAAFALRPACPRHRAPGRAAGPASTWRCPAPPAASSISPSSMPRTLADQDLSVALFEGLRDDPVHAAPGGSIDYAWAHRAVIAPLRPLPAPQCRARPRVRRRRRPPTWPSPAPGSEGSAKTLATIFGQVVGNPVTSPALCVATLSCGAATRLLV